MLNFEMNRDQVEKLLDLQVRTGNMSEKVKEEKLREYDMIMQQRQSGQPGPQQGNPQQWQQPQQGNPQQFDPNMQQQYNPNMQQFGQPQQFDPNMQQQFGQPPQGNPQQWQQPQQGQPSDGGYPRIKPHAEGYLSGPDMIFTVVLAILVVVAGKMGSASMLGLTMGVLFTFIGAKVLFKDMNAGRRVSFIPIVALATGILMTVYGLFKLFASSEAQDSFDEAGNKLLPFIIIIVGICIIVGSFIRVSSMKKRYNICVQATCVQLVIPRHSADHSPRTRSPIYEYWYNGETRRTFEPVFTNRGLPAIDEVREIYVSDGEDGGFYDPKLSGALLIGSTLLGSFFILMGGLVVFLVYLR